MRAVAKSAVPSWPIEFSPEHVTSSPSAMHENAWPPAVRTAPPAVAPVEFEALVAEVPDIAALCWVSDAVPASPPALGSVVGFWFLTSWNTSRPRHRMITTAPAMIAGRGTEELSVPPVEVGATKPCFFFGALRGGGGAEPSMTGLRGGLRLREKMPRERLPSTNSGGGAGGSGISAKFWTPLANRHQSRNWSHDEPWDSRSSKNP